jgi:hypothetical protein
VPRRACIATRQAGCGSGRTTSLRCDAVFACTPLRQFNEIDFGCRLNSLRGLPRARYTDFCRLDAAARNPGSLFPVFHFIAYGLRLLRCATKRIDRGSPGRHCQKASGMQVVAYRIYMYPRAQGAPYACFQESTENRVVPLPSHSDYH